MKAAVLRELGVPDYDEFAEPRADGGNAVVEVRAAGLNPVDVSIAAGRFYAGVPPLPSVAGREGVCVLDGCAARPDAGEDDLMRRQHAPFEPRGCRQQPRHEPEGDGDEHQPPRVHMGESRAGRKTPNR